MAAPTRFIDYPRAGRQGWRRWIPSWRLVTAVIGVMFLAMIVAFFTAYAATDRPSVASLVNAQTTVVTYGDSKTELGRLAVQNRRNVELAQVPPHTRNAILAAEDRTFYENSGVNPTSIVRAAWANARGKPLQGGSTITQQYVKNYFDLRDRTLSRKAKEFFIALKINREMEKDDILEDYLNTIYFGRGAYGIEAASWAYFNKSVTRLSVSESAFLAGIINAPETYDPAEGEEKIARGTRRWNYVLDGMVEMGDLPADQRAAAKWPAFTPPRKSVSREGQNGYLMNMAVAEAAQKLGIPKERLETGGYKIVTTFDKKLVDEAVKAVNEVLPKKRPKGLQVGLTLIDPGSGQVKAIYGGEGVRVREQNAATQDVAQAGSTFKPFGLVAALESGIGLKSRYDGADDLKVEGVKKPIDNFGDESFGTIDLLKATASSVNTVYVQLNKEVGPEKTKEVALLAGIPDDPLTNLQDNLVNVLGDASPHVIDVAGAYATFANEGVRIKPYSVVSVTEIGTGQEKYRARPVEKEVFKKDVMADLTFALQQVVKRGSGQYARNLGRPAAGKTGTSSSNRSAWFVGYTPKWAAAVAMYQMDEKGNPVPMEGFGGFSSITGGSFPVRIWTDFMERVYEGDDDVEEFPEPEWVGEVKNPAPTFTRKPDPEPTRDRERDDEDRDRGRPTRPSDTETQDPPKPDPTQTRPGADDPPSTLPTDPDDPPDEDEGGGGGNNGGGNGNGRGNGRGG